MTDTNTLAPTDEETMTSKPTIEDCMEQAQVFASTWSLVGRGVFGTTMEQATAEKEALEAMLRAALAAPAQAEPEDLSVAYFMGLHAAKRAPQPASWPGCTQT